MHYKEHKKIKRRSGPTLHFESIIAEDFQAKTYTHSVLHGHKEECGVRLTVKRPAYGAGIHLELIDLSGKRVKLITVELGKSEVAMLQEFLTSIEPELKEYSGDMVPVKLLDLRREKK